MLDRALAGHYNPGAHHVSDTGSTTEREGSAGAHAGGASLGRRIGIALFWLLAAYVVGMAAFSMIPSLFLPRLSPLPPSLETRDCAATLARLEHDLTSRTAAHFVQRTPVPPGVWLSDWDRRFAQLPPACGALQPTRVSLARLRGQLEAMLRRYDAQQAPGRRKVRKALEALLPPG